MTESKLTLFVASIVRYSHAFFMSLATSRFSSWLVWLKLDWRNDSFRSDDRHKTGMVDRENLLFCHDHALPVQYP